MDSHFRIKDLPKDAKYVFIIKPRGYGIMGFLADMRKGKGGDRVKCKLQKELESDINETVDMLDKSQKSGDALAQDIARKYFDAIKRINQICADRKRY